MTRRITILATVVLSASLAACTGSEPAVPPTTESTPTAESTSTAAAETQPGVTVERDLPFATYDGATLTLDLWLPADPSGAPIALNPPVVTDLVQAGAIAVAIRVGGVGRVPDVAAFLDDHGAFIRARAEESACAIRFARSRAAELGNDDPTVVVYGLSQWGGGSAHVALLGATLEERWDEFAAAVGGPPRQVDCLVSDGSTRVDALVGTGGTYDLFVPAFEGRYGRSYVQERDPELQRFLASAIGTDPELTVRLLLGTADADFRQASEDFEAALADAGYDVQLTTFDGGHENPPVEVSLPVFKEVLGL